MLRGLYQIHQRFNREFHSLTELWVSDIAHWVNSLVQVEQEHIREDARAKVLQGLAQRPRPRFPVPTDH